MEYIAYRIAIILCKLYINIPACPLSAKLGDVTLHQETSESVTIPNHAVNTLNML